MDQAYIACVIAKFTAQRMRAAIEAKVAKIQAHCNNVLDDIAESREHLRAHTIVQREANDGLISRIDLIVTRANGALDEDFHSGAVQRDRERQGQ